jgi:hypothetical protein
MRPHHAAVVPLAAFALFSITPRLGAQLTPSLPIRFGFEGGANLTHVAGTQVSDISNRNGWIGGVTLELPLPNAWSFETGALYALKGWTRVEPQTGDQAVAKLDYLEIPALLRYDFRNPSPITPFVGGGASLSFRSGCGLSATSAATGATQDVSCAQVEQSDSQFGFHNVDWGALVAGGVAADLGRSRLTLQARYEYGLTDLQKNNNAHSRAIALTAGLSWPVGF